MHTYILGLLNKRVDDKHRYISHLENKLGTLAVDDPATKKINWLIQLQYSKLSCLLEYIRQTTMSEELANDWYNQSE